MQGNYVPVSFALAQVAFSDFQAESGEKKKMDNQLLANLDKIHTTALGVERVRKNLDLETSDVVEWCKRKIENSNDIIRTGKNWYAFIDNFVITINAHSFTIITAHKCQTQKNKAP